MIENGKQSVIKIEDELRIAIGHIDQYDEDDRRRILSVILTGKIDFESLPLDLQRIVRAKLLRLSGRASLLDSYAVDFPEDIGAMLKTLVTGFNSSLRLPYINFHQSIYCDAVEYAKKLNPKYWDNVVCIPTLKVWVMLAKCKYGKITDVLNVMIENDGFNDEKAMEFLKEEMPEINKYLNFV